MIQAFKNHSLLPELSLSTRSGQVALATGAVGLASLSLLLWWKGRSSTPTVGSDYITTELLDLESTSLMLMVPSISTLTFYQGESENDFETTKQFLQERIIDIVRLNPWLEGKITKHPQTGRILMHHKEFNGALKASTFQCIESDKLSDTMDYTTITKTLNSMGLSVNDGNTVLANTAKGIEEPLFRITLVKLRESHKFALFFSLSHIIADGHTFYSLYGMLSHTPSASNPLRPLIIDRLQSFSKKLAVAMDGNDTYTWAFSPGVMLNIVKTMIFEKPPNVIMQNPINPAWIEEQKKAHICRYQEQNDGSLPTFVSTNDILTSSHFRALHCDVGLMAMNLRNKFPELTDNHAGNYEALVAYQPDDFAYPHLIRQSIPIYHRVHHNPLPSFFSALTCKVGVASSWVTFYQEVSFAGSIKHLYHIPYFNVDNGAAFSDISVFFKPNKQDVALISLSRTFDEKSDSRLYLL